MSAEVVREFEASFFNNIMHVVDAAAADGLGGWNNSGDYIRSKLEDDRNIHVVLKEGSKVTGYMLVVPQNDAISELHNADPLMSEDAARYYVMLAEILPESRGENHFAKLLLKGAEEAICRFGVTRFSTHARVETGLSRILQKNFAHMITEMRRIDCWKYYIAGEPADYFEGTFQS